MDTEKEIKHLKERVKTLEEYKIKVREEIANLYHIIQRSRK